MSVDYYRCLDCSAITIEGKLSFNYVKSLLTLRGSCPACGCERLEGVRNVCTECEKEICVPNDDLGPNCLAAEKDALADMELSVLEERARERTRQDYKEFLKHVGTVPFRRQA